MGYVALAYTHTTRYQTPAVVDQCIIHVRVVSLLFVELIKVSLALSSLSLPPSSPTFIVSLPLDFVDIGDEDLHAARAAPPVGHAQQTHHPLSSAPPTTEEQTAKFPDNTAPGTGESSNKMIVAIVSASTGGVVVLGAVALFVWHTYNRRDMGSLLPVTAEDDTIPHNISKFPEPTHPSSYSSSASSSMSESSSRSSNSSDDHSHDNNPISTQSLCSAVNTYGRYDSATTRHPHPQRLSTIVEERNHGSCIPAAEDFQISTLGELAKVTARFMGIENPVVRDETPEVVNNPDMCSIINNNSSSSTTQCHPPGPSNNTSIKTTDTLNNATQKILRYPPFFVAHGERKEICQQQENYHQLVTSTSSPSIATHYTDAPSLTYSIRKLIRHPQRLSSPVRRKRQSFDIGSIAEQREIIPATPLGMPATQFVPLQNSPFHFVPRLSIMLDPEKRQGIHEIPKNTL
ncbi:hypothetical protein BX666DRAFT_2121837 [Dichotomocladium elegans]|nr:hypothetical protein BX666DRAFT_2121837 [Dichotomocladium elegans]